MTGYKHTPLAREKIREARLGSKNPQYKDGRTQILKNNPSVKKLYQTWISIRRRAGGNRYKKDATDRHAHIYKNLSVCKEWEDWLVFQRWAYNSGWKPGLTIDRINNELGYSPENCRWVTRDENNRNRKCVHRYLYRGMLLTLPQIATLYNIPRDRLYNRVIKYGYSIKDAVNKPVKSGKNWIPTKKPEKVSVIKARRNKDIFNDRKIGMSYKELSKKYNLCERQILDIIKRYKSGVQTIK